MKKIFLFAGFLVVLAAGGHLSQECDRAIKKVPTTKKIIALTFDDGPHPKTTPALLALLEAQKVRATFFFLGENAEKHPDLVAAAAAGHEIANHGYSHRYPNRRTREDFFADLARAETVIAKAAPAPVLFRPPGGGYNDRLVLELARRGYTTILWSIDPRDWERRDAGAIAAYVVGRAGPGAIVLLHEGDAAPATPAAVNQIIDRLRDQGYEFVTVGELLQNYEIRP